MPLVDKSGSSRSKMDTNAEKIRPQSIAPINVANSRRIFRTFREDIENSIQSSQEKDLSLAFATEPHAQEPASNIGGRIVGTEEQKKKDKKPDAYVYGDRRLCGVIVSWGQNALYYMPFTNTRGKHRRIEYLDHFINNRI